jgi:hypothetical protein
MDAELNLHYELDGVPQSALELHRRRGHLEEMGVRVVMTPQSSGDSSTLQAHLHWDEIRPDSIFNERSSPLTIADMRNDWLTNTYFAGHPARGEYSTLVFDDPESPPAFDFREALRPHSSNADDFGWTLNQAEVLVQPSPPPDRLDLMFRTVTPNFDKFVVTLNDSTTEEIRQPSFFWLLRTGENALTMQAVNQAGHRRTSHARPADV